MKKSLCRIPAGFRFTILLFSLCGPTISQAGLVAVWGDTASGKGTLPQSLNNVKAIAGGGSHSLALTSGGTVVAWGRLDSRNANAFIVPAALSNVMAISAGDNHSVALTTGGKVVAWGNNLEGQTNVPMGLSKVIAIAAGPAHNLALRSDGTVVAWGWNFANQSTVPVGLADVKAVAAGASSLALRHDGTIAAWGLTSFGLTNVPSGLSNVTAIAAGGYFNLALKADGTVVAWGNNDEGQTNVPSSATNVVAIAAGLAHGLALKADGAVVAWGRNIFNQKIVPLGLSNVTAIAAGANHNLALAFEGPIQILQEPQSQEVAFTSNTTFSVVVAGRAPLGCQWFFNGSPVNQNNLRVSGATSTSLTITNLQFSDIGIYTVIVSNALGSVISSGATLTVISRPFITQQPVDRTVGAGSDLNFLAAAGGTPPLLYQWNFNGADIPGATGSALTLFNVQPANSGLYFMRVTNIYGGAQTIRASLTVTDSPPYLLRQPYVRKPDQSLATNFVSPVGGGVAIAVDARGSLPLSYQWKFNGLAISDATNSTLTLANLQYHQAGYYSVEVNNALGTTNSAKFLLNVAQVLVAGPPFANNLNTPLGLSNVITVAAGGSHVMALRSDGTVRTWLANANFIFEQGYAVTNVPESVTNVIAIAAGLNHCLALRSNGTVVAWGSAGTHTNVPITLSNVVSIAAGNFRSYAVKSDGTFTGWGSSATIPTGLTNVVAVAAGPSQNLALRRNGTVAMWSAGSSTFSVASGLSNAIALATSSTANRALRQDGTVVSWPLSSTSQPVLVTVNRLAVSNVVALALGSGNVSMILKHDGALVAAEPGLSPFPTTNNISAIAAGGVQSGFGVMVVGNGSPNITLHPYSQIVQKSNTVRLLARAVGLQPMQYQWLWDNWPLPGATNASLVLTNVLGKDAGSYRLIASNALGIAISLGANISIPFGTDLGASLNTTNLQWLTPVERNSPWFVQNRETHDGDAAPQSGAIPNGQQTGLQTIVTGPGTLSFWWKVSSEEDFDFLRVFVDRSTAPLMSISGETGWEPRTITFTNSGSHTVQWVYTKDGSVSAGRDAGWLDEVAFTPAPPTAYIEPASQTVSAGKAVSFFAVTLSEAKPVSYQWMRFGTNLTGATNQTLLLPGVGRKDRGSYSVRVGNVGGSVMTSNATLRVNVQQRLGALQRGADGSPAIFARDADDGALSAPDLPVFEAQVSTNLVHWQALPDSLSITNGSLLLRDPGALLWPQRFYRIVEH